MAEQLFPVYSPNGAKDMHTMVNARDLVNGAGYTWKATPLDVTIDGEPADRFVTLSPHATKVKEADLPKISQQIFNRIGGTVDVKEVAPVQVEKGTNSFVMQTDDDGNDLPVEEIKKTSEVTPEFDASTFSAPIIEEKKGVELPRAGKKGRFNKSE